MDPVMNLLFIYITGASFMPKTVISSKSSGFYSFQVKKSRLLKSCMILYQVLLFSLLPARASSFYSKYIVLLEYLGLFTVKSRRIQINLGMCGAFKYSGSSRSEPSIIVLPGVGLNSSFSFSHCSGSGLKPSDSSYPTIMFFLSLLSQSQSEKDLPSVNPFSGYSVLETNIICELIKTVKAINLSINLDSGVCFTNGVFLMCLEGVVVTGSE